MATINLEGYDSITGKKVPVTESDTLNIPSAALEAPTFTGSLSGSNTIEQALLAIDGMSLNSGVTNNTISFMEHFAYDLPWQVYSSNRVSLALDLAPSFGVGKLGTSTINPLSNLPYLTFGKVPISAGTQIEIEFRFRMHQVTDSIVYMGLATEVQGQSQLPSDAYFLGLFYDSSSSPHFKLYLRDDVAIRYSEDSGVLADTNWHVFRLVYSKATDQATYYLDGAQLGTPKSTVDWVIPDFLRLYARIIPNPSTAPVKTLALDWFKISVDSGLGL